MAQPPMSAPALPLIGLGMTPAQVEEQKLLLLYEMRDRLMRDTGLTELQASASVNVFSQMVAAVEHEELVAMVRCLRRLEKRRRDQRIRAELRTGNADEVAQRHGVSVRRLYEIAGARR